MIHRFYSFFASSPVCYRLFPLLAISNVILLSVQRQSELASPQSVDHSLARNTVHRAQGPSTGSTMKRKRDQRIQPAQNAQASAPASIKPALELRALRNAPKREIRVVKLPNGEFFAFLGVSTIIGFVVFKAIASISHISLFLSFLQDDEAAIRREVTHHTDVKIVFHSLCCKGMHVLPPLNLCLVACSSRSLLRRGH